MGATQVRLAELLGGMSLACDVADGFPLEKVLRTVVLAVELGRRHGLADDLLRDVYYTSLLRYAGCTAFAHEEAHLYGAGDDIATRNVMSMADANDPLGVVKSVVLGVGREAALLPRARAVARLLGDGVAVRNHAHSQCEVSIRMATLVGVSAGVTRALADICERYDGKGMPHGRAGDALALAMRVSQVADITEIAHHRTGREGALQVLRRRSGGQLDPAIARTFLAEAPALFEAIEGQSVWDRYLDIEPRPHAAASGQRLDDVAGAFALFADLKSGYTLGHSPAVAELCARAAQAVNLPESERALLRRAALLHDLGRVGAPNRIWDKPGPLSPPEWERVRLHTYWTERILSQSEALRATAGLAAAAHERLTGQGYHRGLPAPALARAARILAAADAYHAMREPRPHRPALGAPAAEKALAAEVAAGTLDRAAVRAVLEAAGARPSSRAGSWPRGLSDREVEVLRLLARGRSNKEIGAALDISPRTAQHHVIHIYRKIEVSSRAAAALFATEQGLLDP
jgi:HD-GYP domain-containing protein (c-di-GMP phosphodiesterase class II)